MSHKKKQKMHGQKILFKRVQNCNMERGTNRWVRTTLDFKHTKAFCLGTPNSSACTICPKSSVLALMANCVKIAASGTLVIYGIAFNFELWTLYCRKAYSEDPWCMTHPSMFFCGMDTCREYTCWDLKVLESTVRSISNYLLKVGFGNATRNWLQQILM